MTKITVAGPVQLAMNPGSAFYIGLHGGTPYIQLNAGASLEVFTTGDIAIYGALVAKKVIFSGSTPAIHYDLNLRQRVFAGLDTPFAVSNWNETGNP